MLDWLLWCLFGVVVCEFGGCCLLGYALLFGVCCGLGCCWFGLFACMCIVGFGGIIAFCLGVCLLCDLFLYCWRYGLVYVGAVWLVCYWWLCALLLR